MINRDPSSHGTLSIFEPLEGRKLLSVAYPSGVPGALPGTIQAEDFDSGSSGEAYYDTTSGNAGKAYRSTNVDIAGSSTSPEGFVLGWVKAGEWLKYTVTVAEAGTYRLDTRVAADKAGGTFRVEFDGVDKTGAISVPNTGGWSKWVTISEEVTLSAGTQTMRVFMIQNGTSGYVGNFNWFSLTKTGTVQPPPTPQAPAAPSGLTATAASPSQINLTWQDSSSDESGFRVESSTNGTSWSQIATLGANTTSLSVGALNSATRYYFRVQAYNSAGDSAYSNISDATTEAPAPATSAYPSGVPSAIPGIIEAENFDVGGPGIAYHDTTAGNAGTSYRDGDVDISGSASNGHVLGWVKAGEWLKYTVEVGESGVYRLDTRVSSQGTGGTFRVEFNGVDKTGPIGVPNTGNWGSWETVSQDVTLDAGVYVMRVVMLTDGSTNHVGNFNWFELTPTTPVTEAPAAPANLLASAVSSSQINLAWSDNADSESGFHIQRSSDGGATWTQIASPGANATSYSATGLAASTTYHFRVQAFNSVGNSAWSNTASATTPAAPSSGDRPNAGNTGPTGLSGLQKFSGDLTITSSGVYGNQERLGSIIIKANNTVIENAIIRGVVHVQAANVTLRNCLIVNNAFYMIRADSASNTGGLVIENCEITSDPAVGVGGYGFFGKHLTIRRSEIHHVLYDAVHFHGMTGSTLVEDNYFHHLGMGLGAHGDGVQYVGTGGGGTHVIRRNNIDVPIDIPIDSQWRGLKDVDTNHHHNAAVIIKCDSRPIDNVTLANNWFNGGNYTIYSRTGSQGTPTNVKIIDNRFGRNYRYGLFSTNGTVTRTGNLWDDTGGLV